MFIHRVTEQSLMATSLVGLQGNIDRLQRLQQQMTSGKTIQRPSDSPGGTVEAMQLRGDLRLSAQYARNANDGIGWLGTLDGTMTNMVVTGDDLKKLLIFFPGAGSGKDSEFAGGWITGYKIRLFRDNGDPVNINVDVGCQFWTEGRGDWVLEEGFRQFLEGKK